MGIEGGCLCGKVRYAFAGEPFAAVICHCTNCRRQGGSAFSFNIVVATDAYRQTGVTAVFADRGDSGGAVMRHFCAGCGSPIVSLLPAVPGITIVKAGTLDDPNAVRPGAEVFCDSALDWVPTLALERKARG